MDMPTAFKEYRANRPSSAFDPETAAFTAGWQGAEAEVRALREAVVDAAKSYHVEADHDWFGPTLPVEECTDERCIRFRRALAPEPPEGA